MREGEGKVKEDIGCGYDDVLDVEHGENGQENRPKQVAAAGQLDLLKRLTFSSWQSTAVSAHSTPINTHRPHLTVVLPAIVLP